MGECVDKTVLHVRAKGSLSEGIVTLRARYALVWKYNGYMIGNIELVALEELSSNKASILRQKADFTLMISFVFMQQTIKLG